MLEILEGAIKLENWSYTIDQHLASIRFKTSDYSFVSYFNQLGMEDTVEDIKNYMENSDLDMYVKTEILSKWCWFNRLVRNYYIVQKIMSKQGKRAKLIYKNSLGNTFSYSDDFYIDGNVVSGYDFINKLQEDDVFESRSLKAMFGKGGNGSTNARVSIPYSWLLEMGITEYSNEIDVRFYNNTITIVKK